MKLRTGCQQLTNVRWNETPHRDHIDSIVPYISMTECRQQHWPTVFFERIVTLTEQASYLLDISYTKPTFKECLFMQTYAHLFTLPRA